MTPVIDSIPHVGSVQSFKGADLAAPLLGTDGSVHGAGSRSMRRTASTCACGVQLGRTSRSFVTGCP